MYDNEISTQRAADALKRLVLMRRLDDPAPGRITRQQRETVLALIHDLENAGWHPLAFEDALDAAPGTFKFDQAGNIQYVPDEEYVPTTEAVAAVIQEYLRIMEAIHRYTPLPEEQAPQETLYSTKEAAEYLGLSVRTIKHHIHTSGKLKGEKVGHSLVFTQSELDEFAAAPRRSGRPKLQP